MDDFIDKKVIGAMSHAELLSLWEENGMIASWGALQAQASGSVSRMVEMQPGSPQFTVAVSRLILSESRRGLVGMTRRASQQYTTMLDMGGDPSTKFIWVVEGDEGTCSACLANAAEIKTYAEWVEHGLPGAATCEGGDLCRCDLLAA